MLIVSLASVYLLTLLLFRLSSYICYCSVFFLVPWSLTQNSCRITTSYYQIYYNYTRPVFHTRLFVRRYLCVRNLAGSKQKKMNGFLGFCHKVDCGPRAGACKGYGNWRSSLTNESMPNSVRVTYFFELDTISPKEGIELNGKLFYCCFFDLST